jgi:hypothetical protein
MRLEKSLHRIFVFLSATLIVACGGSSSKTHLPPSGLKKRVLLSNPLGNAVVVNDLNSCGQFLRNTPDDQHGEHDSFISREYQ